MTIQIADANNLRSQSGRLRGLSGILTGGAAAPQTLTAVLAPASVGAQYQRNTADLAWSTVDNLLVDDATAATVALTSNARAQFLPIRFAAASIPTTARIDGVTITIRMGADGGGVSLENLYLGDAANNIHSGMPLYDTAVVVPSTMTTMTFGGIGEFFGLSLIPGAFNGAAVGAFLGLKRASGAGTRTVSVQYATMTVHYTTTLGVSGVPKAATCVLMMSNGSIWNANSTKVSRAFFPGMGTPAAVIYHAAGALRGEFGTSSNKFASFSGIAYNVGFAVPSKQAGSFRRSNTTTTAFDGTGMSSHQEQAIPNGQPGHGPQTYNYILMGRSGHSLRASIPTLGDGYADVVFSNTAAQDDFVLVVTAFFGVSAHLHQRFGFQVGETEEVVTTGFEPQFILSNATDQPNSAEHGAYGMLGLGGARRSGSSWSNSTALQLFGTQEYSGPPGTRVPDVLPASLNILVASDTLVSQQTNINEATSFGPDYNSETLQITASTSTSYTLAPTVGSVRDENENGVTILSLAGFNNTFLGWVDTPTATGNWTIPIGFRPSVVVGIGTLATAIGRVQDVADAGEISVFVASGTGEAISQGYHLPNGHLAGTVMPAASYASRGNLRVRSGTVSSPVDRVVASFTGVSSSGATMNVTTADATARKMLVMAFA